jgi:hypothetical protein
MNTPLANVAVVICRHVIERIRRIDHPADIKPPFRINPVQAFCTAPPMPVWTEGKSALFGPQNTRCVARYPPRWGSPN